MLPLYTQHQSTWSKVFLWTDWAHWIFLSVLLLNSEQWQSVNMWGRDTSCWPESSLLLSSTATHLHECVKVDIFIHPHVVVSDEVMIIKSQWQQDDRTVHAADDCLKRNQDSPFHEVFWREVFNYCGCCLPVGRWVVSWSGLCFADLVFCSLQSH